MASLSPISRGQLFQTGSGCDVERAPIRPAMVGGVALLLLVSLVMHLPALRAAESLLGGTNQGERLPERLVARAVVIQQFRQAQRQTIKPAATVESVASRSVRLRDSGTHWNVTHDVPHLGLIAVQYLDLPPPAHV